MKILSKKTFWFSLWLTMILCNITFQSKVAHFQAVEQEKKNDALLKKIDNLAKPNLANPHSTSSLSILSKIKPSDEKQKKTNMAKLQKILTDNTQDSVIESSKSADKNSSIIKQSQGVKNLSTLDDIFKKEQTPENPQANPRSLNDSETSEEKSTESALVAPSEMSGAEELYDAPHHLGILENDEEEEQDPEFHIQDLERVDELTEKIKEDIKAEVLGDLQNKMLIKALEVSYEVYEDINEVRKRYFYFKDSIEQSVQLLKDMVDYLEQFVTDSEENEVIKNALIKKGIEIDEHNHKLLVGLLIKLQEYVDKLHTEIFDTFNDYFKQLNFVHFSLELSDSEKVRKMIQTAAELSIFENNVVDDLTDKIKEVSKLCLDNPRYDHLSKAFAKEFVAPGEGVEEPVKLSRLIGVPVWKSVLTVVLGLVILG
jgi:hypothetical protein